MAWKSKTVTQQTLLVLLSVFVICLHESSAKVYQVGGSQGWVVPDNPNAHQYNPWAENNRFKIGDSLLFVYEANNDSVLQVGKDNYDNCNTASPIATFNDGHSTFTFTQSGPYYFISGIQQNCENKEKLAVVVLADRTKKAASAPAPSAVPSPPSVTSPPPPSENTPTPPAANGPPASPPDTNGALSSAVGRELVAIFGILLGSFIFVI